MKDNVRKTTKEIHQNSKALDKIREKNQCECRHHDNHGQPTIKKLKQPINGAKWQCTKCEKILDLDTMSIEDAKAAIQTVDSMIDSIKICCSETKEAEIELAEKLAKTQFRLRNLVGKAYEAVIHNSGQRRNNRNNEDRNSNVSWNSPKGV